MSPEPNIFPRVIDRPDNSSVVVGGNFQPHKVPPVGHQKCKKTKCGVLLRNPHKLGVSPVVYRVVLCNPSKLASQQSSCRVATDGFTPGMALKVPYRTCPRRLDPKLQGVAGTRREAGEVYSFVFFQMPKAHVAG